jgi:hypothetical protein
MNRARASQGDNDPHGKRGKPTTAQVVAVPILAGIAVVTVIALVGASLWAQPGTALGVVFFAATLIFIIPAVIVILKSNGGSTPH